MTRKDTGPAYDFRPMSTDDLAMVNAWLDTPEVARWWIEAEGLPGEKLDVAYLAETDTQHWIVSLDGLPFAFMQDYDPHAHDGHHFERLPLGSRGIDQIIGVPELIGRGHGSAFIRQHCDRLFMMGAPAIGTDPHPDNGRAIRAYEKAGFAAQGTEETEWGRVRLMVRHSTIALE